MNTGFAERQNLRGVFRMLFGVVGRENADTSPFPANLGYRFAGGNAVAAAPVLRRYAGRRRNVALRPCVPDGIPAAGRVQPFRIVLGVPFAEIVIDKADRFHSVTSRPSRPDR